MQFGTSTMFFRERSVTEALEAIARAGYATAEVWIEHVWWSGETPSEIARQARSLGLGLTVHAASYDLNITSSNRGIRQESLWQISLSITMAAEMEARVVVVHPGRLSSSRDRAADFWGPLLDATRQIDQWAAQHGVPVGLELMERRPKQFFITPEDGARLMAYPWANLRLTVDIAHLSTFGDPATLLERIEPAWIVHVHLSDSRPHQTHVPLGQGDMELAEALSALAARYEGLVSLEGYVPGRGEEVIAANLAYLRHLGYSTSSPSPPTSQMRI